MKRFIRSAALAFLTTAAANATADMLAPKTAAQGCWAQLFLKENFGGRALALNGASEVESVPPDWGFPWDPLYESLRVGPAAVLTVYEQPMFRERTAVFSPGEVVADLDDVMGIFRNIRSVKLRCV